MLLAAEREGVVSHTGEAILLSNLGYDFIYPYTVCRVDGAWLDPHTFDLGYSVKHEILKVF